MAVHPHQHRVLEGFDLSKFVQESYAFAGLLVLLDLLLEVFGDGVVLPDEDVLV